MTLERIRKIITYQVDSELDGLSLREGINWLEDHVTTFGEDAKFEVDYDYSSSRFMVKWTEPESDKEYERRVEAHNQSKLMRRKQYEELKKEFESEE